MILTLCDDHPGEYERILRCSLRSIYECIVHQQLAEARKLDIEIQVIDEELTLLEKRPARTEAQRDHKSDQIRRLLRQRTIKSDRLKILEERYASS